MNLRPHWISTLGDRLLAIRWMDIVILLLGAVMISEFYVTLAAGHFSPDAFTQQTLDYANHNNAPAFWNQFLIWFAANGQAFAPLMGYLSALLTVFLMLLIARGVTTLIVGIFFFLMWMTQWAYPGAWIFEFLFPALFGLCAGLASLPQLILEKNWRRRILGPRFFGRLAFRYRLLIIIISSIALWYAINLSLKVGNTSSFSAWQAALTFGILFLCLAVFDYIRPLNSEFHPSNAVIRESFLYRLSIAPWMDIMTMIIGAMLIIQIYADIAVRWFTVPGYSKLINVYFQSTTSPGWMKEILQWASIHASSIMPVQFIFESLAALIFVLLIFRTPMVLLTAGFFTALMFSEFGVPARWPAHPNDPHTWTWELLLVTCVTYIIGFYNLGIFCKTRSAKVRWLGYQIYPSIPFLTRFLWAVLGGIALWAAGLATHVFGAQYRTTSLLAGITFFILLLLVAFIDYFRIKKRTI